MSRATFLGFIFHMRFCWPQGSILGSFWPHCEAPRLQFEVIWVTCCPPEGSNLGAMWFLCLLLSFLPVLKNMLHIAPTPTPKTFKNILSTRPSKKTSISQGGGGIAKRFTICIYQSEGGDPERRHETPWACDGWGSGAGWSWFFVFAPPRPGPTRTRDPPATHP